MTGERLCNLIVNTVKELPGAQNKFIVKQTPEHIKFCRITSDIFNLPKEKINSVDDAAKNIKVHLTQSNYPLWSLKYFVAENYFDAPHKETYLRFLNLLEEFINPQKGRDVTKVADDIFLIYDKNPVIIEELKNIVLRIPRVVVEEFQPALKNLLQMFSALRNNTEKNFAQAAEQINQSAQIFTDFFENQFEFFTKALTEYVDSATDSKPFEKLFNDAPVGIFFKTRDDFILQMKSRLQKFRQDEKTGKFFSTWQEVTGITSPADWSNKNEIPILCMFQDCLEEAQLYFPALNKRSSSPQLAASY
ncbi:MAG: hypothetical protein IJG32_09650 [Selenomonadaceae bacterium]|nr:hypothetical protein [Selenomonadaceae bacterium]